MANKETAFFLVRADNIETEDVLSLQQEIKLLQSFSA
jgi:hypothetical protein